LFELLTSSDGKIIIYSKDVIVKNRSRRMGFWTDGKLETRPEARPKRPPTEGRRDDEAFAGFLDRVDEARDKVTEIIGVFGEDPESLAGSRRSNPVPIDALVLPQGEESALPTFADGSVAVALHFVRGDNDAPEVYRSAVHVRGPGGKVSHIFNSPLLPAVDGRPGKKMLDAHEANFVPFEQLVGAIHAAVVPNGPLL
jgi:hypothetical protein